MDNFNLKKYLAEGKLSLRKSTTLKEGKGQDLADKYVAKLRSEFKNLSDGEVNEFRKAIAEAFDLRWLVYEGKVNEAKEQTVAKGKWEIVKVPKGSNNSTRFDDRYYLLLGGQHVGGSVTADGSFSPPSDGNSSEDYVMKILKKAKIVESVNEGSTPSIEDVRLYIQKELGRAGEQDAGLDAYIDSIQRDFAAGRDAYDDYEMDDYLEDFENYIADKMDY